MLLDKFALSILLNIAQLKNKFFPFLRRLCKNTRLVNILWYLLPLLAIAIKALSGKPINNFLIYKGVFYHTLAQVNLYDLSPSEYFDKNHYGIIFSLIIAPFCFLPTFISVVLYQGAQLFGLHYMLRKLPLSEMRQNGLMLFLLVDNITHAQNSQTNIFIAFILIGTWIYINADHTAKASFLIVLGFLVKLYGIVGLGLFFFVKSKLRFIAWLSISFVVLFYLPAVITDVDFLYKSYADWWAELSTKNSTNLALDNLHQNLSMVGFVTRILNLSTMSTLWVIIPAFFLQLIPLIRVNIWINQAFQIQYLASLMLFIVLYNTATESSTYIIGTCGVGLWWMSSDRPQSTKMLLPIVFVFIFGIISTTDLMPKSINHGFFRLYAVKAMPYFLVWIILIWQMSFSIFESKTLNNG
jgi:hypothetical protein